MSKPRVLVVDDEESVRFVLGKLLERRGCEVELAGSAEEALGILPERPPAVALVDMVLPGKSGMELLGDIKKLLPPCEVIMITSHGAPVTVRNAIRLGAYDYLEKPFPSLDHVWFSVRKALQVRHEDDHADPDKGGEPEAIALETDKAAKTSP